MKRIFPLVLIVLGVLLSLGALTQLYLNNRATSPDTVDLPNQLGGLRLTESKSGQEAIADVAGLHGKEFPITFGAIGVYGNQDITLWVAGTASDSIALQMTNAMRARIAEGNSPFIPVEEISNGDRTIYALEGMGQKHYYFQSENLIIWMAVDPALADKALQQILEVYS